MKNAIQNKALALGFCAVGVCSPDTKLDYAPPRMPDMPWLDNRLTAQQYFPQAQSVVVTLFNSRVPGGDERIASHARWGDYHETIKEKLRELAKGLGTYKVCVDTSPIHEKSLAAAAGLGWIGKNSLMINPQIGAWGLIGVILTTEKLPFDKPMENLCNGCDKCAAACPRQAIKGRKLEIPDCIAYQTIESKAETIGQSQSVYGCDICICACPYSQKAAFNTHLRPIDAARFRDYPFYKRLGELRLKRNLSSLLP